MCFAVLRLRFVNVVHSLVFRSGLRSVIGVALLFPLCFGAINGKALFGLLCILYSVQ